MVGNYMLLPLSCLFIDHVKLQNLTYITSGRCFEMFSTESVESVQMFW